LALLKTLRLRFIDIVPLLTLDMVVYEFDRKRDRATRFMANGAGFLPASCLVRFCLALKWLNPGFLPRILPCLVTLNLFVNDLFVFIFSIERIVSIF